MKVDPTELVASVDIAQICGVSQSAVSNWKARAIGFPEPVAWVANSSTPLWLRTDVVSWWTERQAAIAGDARARVAILRRKADELERRIGDTPEA